MLPIVHGSFLYVGIFGALVHLMSALLTLYAFGCGGEDEHTSTQVHVGEASPSTTNTGSDSNPQP